MQNDLTCTNSQDWSKFNVDESVKRNLIAAGRVIRSDIGEWVICFSKILGYRIVDLAEAWSSLLGLEIATSLKIRKLKIKTNSQKTFNLVKKFSPSGYVDIKLQVPYMLF